MKVYIVTTDNLDKSHHICAIRASHCFTSAKKAEDYADTLFPAMVDSDWVRHDWIDGTAKCYCVKSDVVVWITQKDVK